MTDLHAVATEPDLGTGKKKFSIYVTGILLCVLLTIIPFWTVMSGEFSRAMTFTIIFTSAVLQFLVQVICFLRLNTKTEQGVMNILSFIFAIVVLVVVVGGSLWIMMNLNYNMMH